MTFKKTCLDNSVCPLMNEMINLFTSFSILINVLGAWHYTVSTERSRSKQGGQATGLNNPAIKLPV